MKTSGQGKEANSIITQPAKTMKAVRIHQYGDASVLSYEEVPVPLIGADEILIKVHAAGVNPVDWKMREGYFDVLSTNSLGILGREISGKVEKVGTLVTRFSPGDLVFTNPSTLKSGGYAEYIAVRSADVAFAPKKISLTDAAGIPLAAQTAWTALFENANLKAGQKVLIHGAAGGVGTFAVQMAKIAGAYVIGTCSEEHMELVTSLGADEIINYRYTDFSKEVKDIDVVFDVIGGETQHKSYTVLKKGGILVSSVGIDNENEAKLMGINAVAFYNKPSGSRLEDIANLIDSGLLKVVVDKTFAMKDVKEAHELSQSHHAKGKIILTVV